MLPFSEVLVGKCRSEFELMGKEPERENLEGMSAEDIDHKLKKLRQRTLGNVEFIGELFKKQMVGLEELEGLVNKLLDTSPGALIVLSLLMRAKARAGLPDGGGAARARASFRGWWALLTLLMFGNGVAFQPNAKSSDG